MELFRVGFLAFTLRDLADVTVVAYLFFKLYEYMKGTVAAQIFTGLLLILAASAASSFLNLSSLDWILTRLTSIWFIVVVVLFQPEIRRVLLFIGQSRIFGRFFRTGGDAFITDITAAVAELSDKHYGALLVFVRNAGMRLYIETGQEMHATVSKRLLVSLFYPNSPLHDGAAILRGNTVEAARCILPLTQNETLSESFGMRHRAALGISELTDAYVVIVSEETGRISVAEDGKLTTGLSVPELRKRLVDALAIKPIAAVANAAGLRQNVSISAQPESRP